MRTRFDLYRLYRGLLAPLTLVAFVTAPRLPPVRVSCNSARMLSRTSRNSYRRRRRYRGSKRDRSTHRRALRLCLRPAA